MVGTQTYIWKLGRRLPNIRVRQPRYLAILVGFVCEATREIDVFQAIKDELVKASIRSIGVSHVANERHTGAGCPVGMRRSETSVYETDILKGGVVLRG